LPRARGAAILGADDPEEDPMDRSRCPAIPFGAPDALLDDGVEILKALLRIDTTNPPGNEAEAADHAAALLAEVGVPIETADSAPGRRNLIARLGPDDGRALVLSAHLDVVPVDVAKWAHPPFEAVEADGCIWGRGAIDMKHMAAMALAIQRHLARTGATLRRGLKVALFADEEAGCELGSLFVARNHPDWLRGDVALTEVGGFTTYVEGHRIYPVQVAEKGFVWLRLHIHGTPGHGSMPHAGNPLLELARIIGEIEKQPFPFQCTQPVRDFFLGMAKVVGMPKGLVFQGLTKPGLSDFLLARVLPDPDKTKALRAMLRTTLAPTIVSGGSKSNVIPGSAELTVDCRILPGTDAATFAAEFRRRIPGNYDALVIGSGPPVVMDQGHPIVGQVFALLREADPGCHPVPQMITGFTDARAFAELGVPCFGFSPVWLPEDIPFVSMFHGHNERIPKDGFRWGLATLHELVRRFCS
jgi:acetylornithine deacetylase/succinyl-diaminopimelate desuccinylase-like protein